MYKKCQLSITQPGNSELLLQEMRGIREDLGLEKGGSRALIAMSALIGGDYDGEGAKAGVQIVIGKGPMRRQTWP